MDELVKLVVQKTGLPDATARIAVQTVIDYLKKKLPGPIAGQIDTVLQGGGGLGDMAKGLGGMLGKKCTGQLDFEH
jgi:hypothetical protein